MANWKITVHLGDFWRDDEKTFEQKRELTVNRIKNSKWRAQTFDKDHFDGLLEELQRARGIHEFDWILGCVYDLADEEMVWLDTVSAKPVGS